MRLHCNHPTCVRSGVGITLPRSAEHCYALRSRAHGVPDVREETIMRKTILSAVFAGVLTLSASLAAVAADQTALRVIVVQTADVPAYVHEVTALQALYKKAGQPITLRVWRATYAGSDTGTIVVSVEFPNFAAIAKTNDIVRTNAEIGAEMKKINSMRKIVSDSLYDLQTE